MRIVRRRKRENTGKTDVMRGGYIGLYTRFIVDFRLVRIAVVMYCHIGSGSSQKKLQGLKQIFLDLQKTQTRPFLRVYVSLNHFMYSRKCAGINHTGSDCED